MSPAEEKVEAGENESEHQPEAENKGRKQARNVQQTHAKRARMEAEKASLATVGCHGMSFCLGVAVYVVLALTVICSTPNYWAVSEAIIPAPEVYRASNVLGLPPHRLVE